MSAEREKEAKARVAVAGAHSLTCTRHGSTTLCSCGGPSRPIAHLDAYAATIAARVRAEVDAELMTDVAREVLCRVFDDGADAGMEEWQSFDKSEWLWWGRALGAFIFRRLKAERESIAARVRAEAGQAALEAETKRADVMGEVWEAGRAMGRRENDAEWRARVEGAKRYDPFKPMGPDDYTMQQVPDGEWIIRRDLLAARCEAHGVIECYCLTAVARDREGPQ